MCGCCFLCCQQWSCSCRNWGTAEPWYLQHRAVSWPVRGVMRGRCLWRPMSDLTFHFSWKIKSRPRSLCFTGRELMVKAPSWMRHGPCSLLFSAAGSPDAWTCISLSILEMNTWSVLAYWQNSLRIFVVQLPRCWCVDCKDNGFAWGAFSLFFFSLQNRVRPWSNF